MLLYVQEGEEKIYVTRNEEELARPTMMQENWDRLLQNVSPTVQKVQSTAARHRQGGQIELNKDEVEPIVVEKMSTVRSGIRR